MNQLSVFISCVSPEFRQTRSRVAYILTQLGYTPVIQDIFGTEPGDLRQILRGKIDDCKGLIQIVGQGYGAEPPTVDADYGRVSYTQFEFLYARSQKKKIWLLFAGEVCTRDTPLERLDLPNDPAHLDPVAYQAERRALQLTYREERQKDGHLYYDASSDADLELKVERLRGELAELRHFEARQKEILARLAITTEKIRAHLLESTKRTHQADLAEAGKAKGWEERERLRQAAERANAGRLSGIDELAASFAEIEGTSRSTQIFDEMICILAEKGVDQALAYAATQRTGILKKVKARATACENNRADLLPLLKSAQLEAERNQPAEAVRLFADILALEPDWSEALDAQFRFQITQAECAFYNATLTEASGHLHAAEITVQRLLKDSAQAARDVSTSLNSLGELLAIRGQPGDAEKALAYYQRCNEVLEGLLRDNPDSAQAARDVSVSLNKLGDFLSTRGQPGDAEKAMNHYRRSVKLREGLPWKDSDSAQAERDDINTGPAFRPERRPEHAVPPDVAVSRPKRNPFVLLLAFLALGLLGALAYIILKPSEPVSPAPLALHADLTVESDPPGAMITLDGDMPLKAPHTFKDVRGGGHQLTAILEGYLPVQRDLQFYGTTSSRIVLKLEKDPSKKHTD